MLIVYICLEKVMVTNFNILLKWNVCLSVCPSVLLFLYLKTQMINPEFRVEIVKSPADYDAHASI